MLRRTHFFLLLALLGLAVALRLPSLATTPSWYTDEGFYLNVASEIAHGHWRTFGVEQWTTITPLAMNPPLFYLLLAPLILLFGKTLIAGRILMVLIGVVTVWSLWFIGGKLFGRPWLGLLPAAAYAVLPEFVVNNRWIFPQPLTGLLLLWAFFLLWRYRESRKTDLLLGGAGCLGAAMLVVYWAWWFFPVAVLLMLGAPKRRFWSAVAIAIVPSALSLALAAVAFPHAFSADIPHALNGPLLSPRQNPPQQILWEGIRSFFSRDILFVISMFGLVFIRQPRLRWFLLLATASVAVPLLFFRPDYERYFYSALIFTPLLLLGLAGITDRLLTLPTWFGQRLAFVLLLGFGTYLALWTARVVPAIADGTVTTFATSEPFIADPDVPAMRAVADFVNSRTTETDFVIAPNNLNWQLKAFSVEPVWVACYEHRSEFSNLWDDRFTRPLAVNEAAYAVDDTLFPGDTSICQSFRPEVVQAYQQWPVALTTGRFIIYQNPIQ